MKDENEWCFFFFLFLRFLRFPFDRSCETLKKEGEGEKSGEGNSRGTSAKKRRYIVFFCSCLFLRIAFKYFFFFEVWKGTMGKRIFRTEHSPLRFIFLEYNEGKEEKQNVRKVVTNEITYERTAAGSLRSIFLPPNREHSTKRNIKK